MSGEEIHTGGCQCGAVRYRFSDKPQAPLICHCRMCQKAFGSPFAAFVGAPKSSVSFSRGMPSIFKSSDAVERGFCRECGTPLSYAHVDGDWLCISIASLDSPALIVPKKQYRIEARLDWVSSLGQIPVMRPTKVEKAQSADFIADTIHQHPDHDTDEGNTT